MSLAISSPLGLVWSATWHFYSTNEVKQLAFFLDSSPHFCVTSHIVALKQLFCIIIYIITFESHCNNKPIAVMAWCITNTSLPTLKLAIRVGSDVFLKGMTDDHRSQPPLWGGDGWFVMGRSDEMALARLFLLAIYVLFFVTTKYPVKLVQRVNLFGAPIRPYNWRTFQGLSSGFESKVHRIP
jgi:hypothetical protein